MNKQRSKPNPSLAFDSAAREALLASASDSRNQIRPTVRAKPGPICASRKLGVTSPGLPKALRSLTLVAAIVSSNFTSAGESRPHSVTQVVYGVDRSEYVASINVLMSASNQWLPGRSPFPVDVAAFSKKAKNHLIERHKRIHAIELINLEYKTIGKPYFEGFAGKSPSDPVWYVVFEFRCISIDGVRLERPDSTVVMMIDGTILKTVKKGAQ